MRPIPTSGSVETADARSLARRAAPGRSPVTGPAHRTIDAAVVHERAAEVVERVGCSACRSPPAGGPVAMVRRGTAPPLERSPVVVDLSSLWAGPLCAQLLGERGRGS